VSEPEDAPLHPAFEWDDEKCCEQIRLIQARQLIRAIIIVPDRPDATAADGQSVYAHVPCDPEDDAESREGKYVPLALLSEDDAEYERALTEAQKFLDAAERRFAELRYLAEVKGGKTEALAIATQAFSTVREAMALLR